MEIKPLSKMKRFRATRMQGLPRFLGHLLLLALLTGTGTAGGRWSRAEADGVDEAQIEADWLRQAVVRENAAPGGAPARRVKPEQDAAGGCDGVKDGKWGFHTADEEKPWWQVDLGKPWPLDRMVLYNRCDECAGRNSRIIVLLSDDAVTFRQVYQHDGTTFLGHTDKLPLSVPLQGAVARHVRLQLPGKSYFHLDEVEIYAAGGQGEPEKPPAGEDQGNHRKNIALGKPATQSSVSQWSKDHASQAHVLPDGPVAKATVAKAIERGLRLAENLRSLGTEVEEEVAVLRRLSERLQELAAETPAATSADELAHEIAEKLAEEHRRLYLNACRTARALALRNPLLDFESILFAKSAPGRFPHISDQFYGWWSRPGGGIFLLEGFKGPRPEVRCLTADMPEWSFLRPDLSYDGKKILFACCRSYPQVPDLPDKADKSHLPEDAFYHVFEMSMDGSSRRQLTRGRYDDFDARYLPGGDIVFLSTRKGQFLQSNKANSEATRAADLPDSYVRCGGDNYRPVPVFTLHAMDAEGGSLRPISAFENFEWTPAVAADGQILYTRWDYIDRFNGHFFSLWSTRPDGANPQLVYGNFTVRPQVVMEARPVPGSTKLVFTASAHHSITGGSLALLDRSRGTEGEAPLVRLTPEIPFPETEAWPECYYASPYPLSEEHYLVAWSDRKLPPHCRVDSSDQNPPNASGIYLYDAFGNLNLLHRDPAISSTSPIPVRPRRKPPVFTETAAWDGPQEGSFLLQDVYRGMPGIPRGTVKHLRVIGVPPKTQPHMNQPTLGVSSEDPGKYLLGTVPVEEDGSAHFRAPSGIPVFFQAVGGDGLAVQTMRSLTYVWPGQTLSCVGCHESREDAPPAIQRRTLAASREPSRLRPGPAGSWPLRFDELVQPILDKSCVSCHRPDSGDEKAAKLDLTLAGSYESLLSFGGTDLRNLVFERDQSPVGECAARKSKLFAFLRDEKGHEGVRLDEESLGRIAVWIDLYAQRLGHFSDEQEKKLRDLRLQLAPLLQD